MSGLTVGHIAERNAMKWPETEATVRQSDEGRINKLTFAEFNERTDQLAEALRRRGVERTDTVAIYMKNNLQTLESFIGIMKIGALPVPVNHRFKDEEVKYVLADSNTSVCILDSFGTETVRNIHDDPDMPVKHYISVAEEPASFADSYDRFIQASDSYLGEIVPDRGDEAGIMYTSGTTGKPKGCVYTHDNLIQIIRDSAYERDNLEPGNRHLISTPLFHVGAFIPFLSNFFVAGTTVVADGFDPKRTMEILEEEQINSTYLVPTQTRQLLDIDGFEEYDISSFTDYSTGAAPVGAELKQETMERFECGVTESFGQTEALALLLPSELVLEKAESVGRPALNLHAKVVDPETREDLPPNEVGLIAYKGPAVFERYHNMPEKTANVFTEDGWFVSGDLVRMDEDGFFYFIGRSDDMIISGGENVYPAEIEETLYEHTVVDEVAVVGVPDDKWGERIKACVVPEREANLTKGEVIRHVKQRLADYKKPREVEFHDELPRNPTGKVIKEDLK